MAIDRARFIPRFIDDARDRLTQMAAGLDAPGARAADPETINDLFRAAHTIKGSAGMLALTGIAELAHCIEDLLAALRAGERSPDDAVLALVLRGVDALSTAVDALAAAGAEPPADAALCAALVAAARGPVAATTAATSGSPDAADATDSAQAGPPAEPPARSSAEPRLPLADSVRVPLAKLDSLIGLAGELLAGQARLRAELRALAALERAASAGGHGTMIDAGAAATEAAAPLAALRRVARALRTEAQAREALVTEIGERALALRMLPLAMVLEPAARMARELARGLGKEVRCEVSGGDIELDRQLIEALGGALVHVLRNAVDHGLEPAAERLAAGKPAVGTLGISARHRAGGVEVEVSDDGRGLDRARIIAQAVKRGLVAPAAAATLGDDDVRELIFAPGFSTSDGVNELSGRGVGMDAVRRAIVSDLHGTLALTARPGLGTRIVFRLPRSLAVMRLLIFNCAGYGLGLAARHVEEVIRVEPGAVIRVAGAPALLRHDELVPLLPLAALLGLADGPAALDLPAAPRHALVLAVHDTKLALSVDRLLDERALVVKPLPEHLRGCALVAGVAESGDGTLVSVLQPGGLLDAARRLRGEPIAAVRSAAPQSERRDGRLRVLVADDSRNTREIVATLLDAHGYLVTTAEDGLDAWQKARAGGFDALLTDVEMPGLDGFALTERLRADPRWRTLPILILTSRALEADRRRGAEVGADAYIVKGDFNQSSLLDTLSVLLGTPA